MNLYQIVVVSSLVWGLVSSITFGYALVWMLVHPRRKFTPRAPKPPTRPFVGTLHHTLPSVEPTRTLRSQAVKRADFDQWLREQDMLANPQVIQLQEWQAAHSQAKG